MSPQSGAHMSSRVYRPLAALLLGLLFEGLFAWFTKGSGSQEWSRVRPPGGRRPWRSGAWRPVACQAKKVPKSYKLRGSSHDRSYV